MTPNKEDYLKCIYEIGTEEGKITNKEIANRMEVSPPAVTEMIKKLISPHRSLFGGPLAIFLRSNSSRS